MDNQLQPQVLSTALDTVSDGVVALDKNWQVIYVNRGAELLLRKQRQLLMGNSWWEIFSYLRGTPTETDLLDTLASKLPRRLKVFHPPLYAWHELEAVPASGHLLVVFRDVTDIIRMRQRGAVKEAVREVLDPAPIAISILRGPEHRIEYMNPMSTQLLGGRNMEGRTVRNAFPELEDQGFFGILDEVYRSGTPFRASGMTVTFDRYGEGQQEESVFDITYQPFFESDGRVAGILGLSVEVAR